MPEPIFDLDTKSSVYIASLMKHLERTNQQQLLEITQKSGYRVLTQYCEDNDGYYPPSYGHKVQLFLPIDIFVEIVDNKKQLAESLREELSKIYDFDNEYIHSIDIILDDSAGDKVLGQKISAYTCNKLPSICGDDLEKIWGAKTNLKVFISHRDKDKKIATKISSQLKELGISSFVAHEDIKPTKEWQKEILKALQSMDLLLAYIGKEFFNSVYTNQEIGFALGSNIPIVSLKEDSPPEGFISILQAQRYDSTTFTSDFISLLLENLSNLTVKTKLIDSIIDTFANAPSFAKAGDRFKLFNQVKKINEQQEQKLVHAFNSNTQISSSFHLNGKYSNVFIRKLNAMTGKFYAVDENNKLIILK